MFELLLLINFYICASLLFGVFRWLPHIFLRIYAECSHVCVLTCAAHAQCCWFKSSMFSCFTRWWQFCFIHSCCKLLVFCAIMLKSCFFLWLSLNCYRSMNKQKRYRILLFCCYAYAVLWIVISSEIDPFWFIGLFYSVCWLEVI